ncbi:MAG: helix-turn-helix domain-containing protein [Myxococcales bacterium]|nr:MAG: helix-turn-helix domain-containing protein [Myxococcales bacterium]
MMKRCRNCGSRTLVQSVQDRQLDSLPSVRVCGLKVSRCQECGEEAVSIPRLEQLHRVVAHTLVKKPGLLSGPQVRYLRKWLGWAAQDLARRFDLTPEHVSRIENGHLRISVTADRLLRMLVLTKDPVEKYSPEELLDTPVSEHPFDLTIRSSDHEWDAVA